MNTAEERSRSVALAGLALAALVAGGWWWRAAAPAPTAASVGSAGPVAASPTVGPRVSTALDRFLVTATPGERLRVQVDGAGETVRTEIDPVTGVITDIEGDPSWLFFEGELPAFRETIWRERTTLVPGQRVVRQTGGGESRQVLQYRCTRPGTLLVTVSGAELAGPSEIDCDGMTTSAQVLAHGTPFRVTLSSVGVREIDVEAQLVVLSR